MSSFIRDFVSLDWENELLRLVSAFWFRIHFIFSCIFKPFSGQILWYLMVDMRRKSTKMYPSLFERPNRHRTFSRWHAAVLHLRARPSSIMWAGLGQQFVRSGLRAGRTPVS